MSITAETKTGIIASHRIHASDTGSPEIQVAMLTARITDLTEHLKDNRKDHSARRGLLKMVGRRSGLLKYLTNTDRGRYQNLISSLGLRK